MGIKQIAKLANVSIGTVDRVLHKRSGVSKATEKKVLQIIKETGYTKNTTASRLKLASVKKIRIAILIPEGENKWSYWKLPKKGILKAVEELSELGVVAEFYDFSDTSTFVSNSHLIFEQNYDALVTVPFFGNETKEVLKRAKSNHIPVVFLDTEIPLEDAAYFIRQNSYNAGKVAGRLLHGLVGDRGQYYIVNLLNEQGIHENNKQRELGFREFFEQNGFEADIRTINHPINDTLKVTKELETWLKNDLEKGVFVTNSRAYIIAEILKQYGISNTSIVGFDLNHQNKRFLESNDIHFLINQKPKYQGYAAIKSLFNFLTKDDATELSLDIPVEIIIKENIP